MMRLVSSEGLVMALQGRLLSSLRVLFVSLALAGATAPASLARVEVTLDAETLNEFLSAVTPPRVLLPLPSGKEIALELHDLHVNGFDPAAGSNGRGHVLTSVRVGIPALGLEFPLEPKLSLDVAEENGSRICILRFERVEVLLPVTGALDISSLLPPYRVPAEAAWTMTMRQGDVQVKSRLVQTRMGADALRFGFDLEMSPKR